MMENLLKKLIRVESRVKNKEKYLKKNKTREIFNIETQLVVEKYDDTRTWLIRKTKINCTSFSGIKSY